MVNEVLVDRTVDAPSDLALLHPSGETRSGSSSSGTFSPVYAGVSKAETVITCHPEPGVQICAKCEAASSELPIAKHEHSS
jgi:hypothetical protein